MIAALISALAGAASLIVDKFALSRERIGLRVFLPLGFIFVFFYGLALTPLLGRIDLELALLPNMLFLLFLMILMAMTSNVFFYQGLQENKAHEVQAISMFIPLLTILLAAVFFQEEFDARIFILGIIASLALVWARFDKSHLKLTPTTYNLFLAVILIAAESIVIRELLYAFTPIALYAVRAFFLSLFFMLYYRPRYRQVSQSHWWLIAGSALLGFILMVTRYYAFWNIGVITTTLVSALAPVIVFIASWEMLHEKIKPKVIAASLVILVCVSWAIIISVS